AATDHDCDPRRAGSEPCIRELAEEGSDTALLSQAGNYDARCRRQHVNHNVRSSSVITSSSHTLEQCGLTSGSCVFMGLGTIQVRPHLLLSARALDARGLTFAALRH